VRGCTDLELGVEHRGDQLDLAQPRLGDRIEGNPRPRFVFKLQLSGFGRT
jgi:hypothetical protein